MSNKGFIIQHAKLVCSWIFIYRECMRDRSMRRGTELAREIKLTDWSMAGNLSNRSSGVQIPRDICTRLKRYLYSAKCSCIIKSLFTLVSWAYGIIQSYLSLSLYIWLLPLSLQSCLPLGSILRKIFMPWFGTLNGSIQGRDVFLTLS